MANLEVIALDTVTPQLKAPQAGDGYAMPRPVTVTEVVGSTALTLTGATQTTAVPVLNATQTWNNVATTFTGIKLNVTDTTSSATSLLMDLQTGGGTPVSRFNVRKDGVISLKAGANPGDISADGAGRILISSSSTAGMRVTGNFLLGGTDLALERDAANTLAQRNSTNAQTFRVYNTYTDASNYERGKIAWASNVLQIGTEKAGTGTARNLDLQTDGVSRWTIDTSGNFTAAAAGQSIGNVAGGRPVNFHQTGYWQTNKMTAPAAPAVNAVRIYAEDNGAGKTRLMALFNTGAAQQIAIEP